MKKRVLFLLTMGFAVSLLLFACRKDIGHFVNDDNRPKIESELLESAKIWNDQVLAQNSAYVSKEAIRLKPQWNESWTVTSIEGVTSLVVPAVENHVSNRTVSIRRVFIFDSFEGNIAMGKIVEFVGFKYSVTQNLDKLVANIRAKEIAGFNGAIVEYNVNYKRINGRFFKDGVTDDKQVSIVQENIKSSTSKSRVNNNPLYLQTLESKIGITEKPETIAYLYTPNSVMTGEGGSGSSGSGSSGSGSGSSGNGSGSGSQLNEVVIVGTGTPPPVIVPPYGGSGGGNTPPPPPPPIVNTSTGYHLCQGLQVSPTGNAYTGALNNLGFIATITEQGASPIVVNSSFGIVCFAIPNYSYFTSSPGMVTDTFMTAYNVAVDLTILGIKGRQLPWNSAAIQSFLIFALTMQLNAVQLGSTVSTGPCANIPSNNAIYCMVPKREFIIYTNPFLDTELNYYPSGLETTDINFSGLV